MYEFFNNIVVVYVLFVGVLALVAFTLHYLFDEIDRQYEQDYPEEADLEVRKSAYYPDKIE